MTDFNTDNTDGSDRDDAGRERRRNRAKGKITEYADVKAIAESPVVEGESQTTAEERASMKALLAQMEKAMEAIDRAPDSFECIIDYGNPPLKKLGDLGNEMIKVQSKFNESVNVMGDALSQLQSGLKGMNMDKLGENAKALMNSLIKGGGKAAKGVGSFFSSLFGKKKTTTEEQKLIEEMQKALPEMLKEMLRLVHTIEETDKGLKIVITEAEKLGKARVECTRELGVYLGASKEVLRRYKDEYIPEAKEAFEASGDPQDEMYFKEVVKCQERFINRIAILEGSRAQSVIQAQQLQQMISTMEDQREKNQDIIHNSQPEWKAMLAAAGIAGSSLKAAQNAAEADAFGDKIHEQTFTMIEEAQKMTLESKARGTVDPAKLIDGINRIQAMIDREADAQKNRLLQLDETSKALRGATDKLIEAADEAQTKRLLEASEEDTAPSNDNGKKSAPEKKTGTDNTPKT